MTATLDTKQAVSARRGRRVRRVLRRIDPWSVLRVSAVFYICIYLVLLVAGIVLWLVATWLGAIDNVEDFIGELLALNQFQFETGQILRASAIGGAVFVVLGTGVNVLGTILFNLISDLVGGVELTLLEEEPVSSRSVV